MKDVARALTPVELEPWELPKVAKIEADAAQLNGGSGVDVESES